MQTNDTSKKTNPWNGLRTYLEGEVLYGRNSEIQVLSLLVMQNCQTVVYGRSGIGKSSILNAGIFPIVREHGIFPVYIRLEHNVEVSYLDQIKAAINREVEKSQDGIKIHSEELVEPTSTESLWEFFHRINYKDGEGNVVKPLIVFDQFEEIFTLESNHSKVANFFSEITDLLNNVKPEYLVKAELGDSANYSTDDSDDDILGLASLTASVNAYKSDPDFHIVFTLREDFLSYLERNTTDIPSLKNNRYCLQPINDEQAAEIIMQPRKGLVTTTVAKLIIEKVTGETNFEIDGVPEIMVDSAILSLYLSRLYEKMESVGDNVISRDLVETYSANIIEDFYADAISGLSKQTVEWLEDTLINEDGRRDNRDRSTVLRESGMTDAELDHLVNDVKLLRQFSYGGDLRIEFIHDVLCPVIVARRLKRNEDKRIHAVEEAARKEKLQARRRIILVSAIAVFTILIAAGIYLYNQYMNVWPTEEYYAEYQLKNGWPVGLGQQLTKDQRSRLPLYYKLSHNGHRKAQFDHIEVLSSNKIIPSQDIQVPYLLDEPNYNDDRGQAFQELVMKVRSIEFKPDQNGDIDFIEFMDKDNDLLYSMNRYATLNGDWYTFTNRDGGMMTIRNSGIDRIKLSVDSLGYPSTFFYYDNLGVKREIADSIYGYKQLYDEASTTLTTIKLDVFNHPGSMTPNAKSTQYEQDGNTLTYLQYADLTNQPTEATDAAGVHKIIKRFDRWQYFAKNSTKADADWILTRDKHGNILKAQLQYNSNQRFNLPDITEQTFNKNGQKLTQKLLTANQQPFSPNHAIYLRQYGYDDNGDVNYREFRSDNGREYLYRKQTVKDVTTTEFEDNQTNTPYIMQVDSVKGNLCVTRFYNEQRQPINYYSNEYDQSYHKGITVKNDSILNVQCFAYVNGSLEKLTAENCEDYRFFEAHRTYDKRHHLLTNRTFDCNNNILLSLKYYYQGDDQIGKSVMGIDGNAVRCDQWDDDLFLYYILYYNRDFNDDYCDFKSVNEFDIISPLRTQDNLYIKIAYVDLNGQMINKITDNLHCLSSVIYLQKSYWQYIAQSDNNVSTTGVSYLHLLSKESKLYQLGLKDGDIILDGNNHPAILNQPSELISMINNQHELIVMRANPNENRYERTTIKSPSNIAPAEANLIHIHVTKLGLTEAQMFNRCLNK